MHVLYLSCTTHLHHAHHAHHHHQRQRPHTQASAEFAAVLQDLGFTVTSMGGETRLDLAAYNFTGVLVA